MIKKVKFSISTHYVKSSYVEEQELEFDDDATEEQITEEIEEIYSEWLAEHTYGGWEIIR
jgi:hypothetical protein